MKSIQLTVTADQVIDAVYECGWDPIDAVAMLNLLHDVVRHDMNFPSQETERRSSFADLKAEYEADLAESTPNGERPDEYDQEEANKALASIRKWEA